MAQDLSVSGGRYLRLGVFLCFSALLLCAAPPVRALTRAEIYQATAPIADRTEPSQAAAFQAALRIVLIRVTGRRNADEDPALAPLVTNASRYVQQYRRAPDNSLTVSFDGAAIERWLTQNGQPLWGHERPSTFVWLGLSTGPQSGTVVTADDTSELKAAIDAAAVLRGAPITWPSAADVQRNHLDYANLASVPVSNLADISHQLGAEGTLVGRASNATVGAVVRWTLLFQDRSSEFSGGPVEGVNRAADLYAGMFSASGATMAVDIEVSGVSSLKDYAAVQTYLESLALVSHVGVGALNGDIVRFQLATRGGAEALQHVLALNGRLQPAAAADDGIQRFQLRR